MAPLRNWILAISRRGSAVSQSSPGSQAHPSRNLGLTNVQYGVAVSFPTYYILPSPRGRRRYDDPSTKIVENLGTVVCLESTLNHLPWD